MTSLAVVIVNYGTPERTIACVESLLRSTLGAPRIILVDNASPDDSVARLRVRLPEWPSVSLDARSVNDGYAGGNNAGLGAARALGCHVAFVLNSDTILAADCIALLAREMERDARTALVCPRIFHGHAPDLLWFGGGTFSLWSGRPVHVGLGRTADQGWLVRRDLSFASGCALLLRLDAVSDPVFDPTLFSYAEDLDLSLRLRKAGRRIRYVPEARVWHFAGASHRRVGGQALRWYLNTRNVLRVAARHARWYHWPILGPMLWINVVARFCAVSLRNGDLVAFAATLRGALHAMTGSRHAIERAIP